MNAIALPRKRAQVPGPRGIPFLGSLFEFAHSPLHCLIEGTRGYGDIVRFRLGPLSVFLLNHPAYVQHVFQDNSRNYRKGIGYAQMKPLLGNGLLVSEGELWLHQRRMIQPNFHRQYIVRLTPLMTETIDTLLARWESNAAAGEPLDVAAEMARLTRALICRVLFGSEALDESNELARALDLAAQLSDNFTMRLTRNPLALLGALGFIPSRTPAPVKQAIRELDDVIYQAIAERRAGRVTGDLLSALIHLRDEKSGESMSDKQVRDEAVTIFLAGNETAAIALTWLWYLLAQNPEAEQRLDAELVQVLDGRTPAVEDLARLEYTRRVVHETMRLYPPAWMIVRTSVADDEIDGWHIPGGSLVILSPYLTHRHTDFWKDPEAFEPARFAEPVENSRSKNSRRVAERPHYAYFPFGGGARQCMGNHLGLMEAQLTTAMVAQRYRLQLLNDRVIQPEAMITLRPRGGMPMRLERK